MSVLSFTCPQSNDSESWEVRGNRCRRLVRIPHLRKSSIYQKQMCIFLLEETLSMFMVNAIVTIYVDYQVRIFTNNLAASQTPYYTPESLPSKRDWSKTSVLITGFWRIRYERYSECCWFPYLPDVSNLSGGMILICTLHKDMTFQMRLGAWLKQVSWIFVLLTAWCRTAFTHSWNHSEMTNYRERFNKPICDVGRV